MTEHLTFDDVLITPGYNDIPSRGKVILETQLKWLTLDIPIFSANMDTITGPEMAAEMHGLGCKGILHRFNSNEDAVKDFVDATKRIRYSDFTTPVSVGVGAAAENRAEALMNAGARVFCVDVAHGHSKQAGQMVKFLRNVCEDYIIIAGNVATYAGADYLASCGADAVKVGIGPGSVCQTRIKTGVGVPQLSAIQDCAKANAFIIADGGIRNPGDAAKALAAGAHAVMIGGMLAGTDETPGEVKEKRHPAVYGPGGDYLEKVKVYRGMASKEAQDDFMGKMNDWKTSEGVSLEVPCKGPAANVIKDIAGGLRSAFTYVGAKNLDEFHRKARFIRISSAGFIEGTPHKS